MRFLCRSLSILVLAFPVMAAELTEAAKKAFADYITETESGTPAGGITVAVFDSVPVALALIVAATV